MRTKKITKAIFPVAGLGTRFLPATKSIPKEIMTLVDRPLIQYAIDEARAAGIKEFIFVTSRGKSALEDYFDHSPELENTLRKAGKDDLLEILKETNMDSGAIAYVRQNRDFLHFVNTGEFTKTGSSAWDGYAAAQVAETGARALASGTKLAVEMIAKPEFYA